MKVSIYAPQVLMDSILSDPLVKNPRISSISTVLSDKEIVEKEIKHYVRAESQIQKSLSGNVSTALIQTDFDWPHDPDGIQDIKAFLCKKKSLISKVKIEARFMELQPFAMKKNWASIVLDAMAHAAAISNSKEILNDATRVRFLESYHPVSIDKKYGMINAFWLSFQSYLNNDNPAAFITPNAAMKLGLMSPREYFIVRTFVPKNDPLQFSKGSPDCALAKNASSPIRYEIAQEYKKALRQIEFQVLSSAKLRQEIDSLSFICHDVIALLQKSESVPSKLREEFVQLVMGPTFKENARKIFSYYTSSIYPNLSSFEKSSLEHYQELMNDFVFLAATENSILMQNWVNEQKLFLQKNILSSKMPVIYDDIETFSRQMPGIASSLRKEIALLRLGSSIELLRSNAKIEPHGVASVIKNSLIPMCKNMQKDLSVEMAKITNVLAVYFGNDWQIKLSSVEHANSPLTKKNASLLVGDLKKAFSSVAFDLATSLQEPYVADKLELDKGFVASKDYYKKLGSAVRDIFVLEHISQNGFPVGYESVELSGNGLISFVRPALVSVNALAPISKPIEMFDKYKKIFTSFETFFAEKNKEVLQNFSDKMFSIVTDYIRTNLKTPDAIVEFLEKTSLSDLNKSVAALVSEKFPQITIEEHAVFEKMLRTKLHLSNGYENRVGDFVTYPYACFFMVASTESSLEMAKCLATAQTPDRVSFTNPLVTPDQFHSIIDSVIEKRGVQNVAQDGLAGALGGYVDGKNIVVNDMHDDLVKLSTKLHEFAHLLYHFNSTSDGFKLKTVEERLDMYKQWGITLRGEPPDDKNCHAIDELLAESLATYVLSFYGYSQTHAYLKSYYTSIQAAALTKEERSELQTIPREKWGDFLASKNALLVDDLTHIQRAFYHQASIMVKEIDRETRIIVGKSRDQLYKSQHEKLDVQKEQSDSVTTKPVIAAQEIKNTIKNEQPKNVDVACREPVGMTSVPDDRELL